MEMLRTIQKMEPGVRRQFGALCAVRSFNGMAKAVSELGQSFLLLQLCQWDYARAGRIANLLSTINTCSDFFFSPLIGSLIDAQGRRGSVLLAQLVDTLAFLLVGLRPSIGSFVLWQLVREFTRRAFKPARLAMLGDLVGRGSIEFVYGSQAIDTVAELGKMATLQLCARIVPEGDYHRNFVIGAGCNVLALLCASGLRETLPSHKKRKLSLRSSHPLAFLELFGRSGGMSAVAVLLASWSISGRKMLPVKEFQKRRFGIGMQQQANLMLAIQLCELASPVFLPKVIKLCGVRGAAQLSHWASLLTNLNMALSPYACTVYLTPLLRPLMHMEVILDKVVADEAKQVEVGQGELFMAQQSLEFVAKLIFPWVFGELFARSLDSGFPGAPFALAALVDLGLAQALIPWVWRRLSREPEWQDVD